jgi:hypothetical protein
VDTIPFVLESHPNGSFSRYCKIAYTETKTPLTVNPKFSLCTTINLQYITDAKDRITKEIIVNAPIPRPVLPNNVCSNGASLNIKINTTCKIIVPETTLNMTINLLDFKSLKCAKTDGIKKIANKKRVITFGTIKESLLKNGVVIKVIKTAP